MAGSLADLINAKKPVTESKESRRPDAESTQTSASGTPSTVAPSATQPATVEQSGETSAVETQPAQPEAPALSLSPLPGHVEIESVKDQTGKMRIKDGLESFLKNLRDIPSLFDSPEILSAQIRGIMVDLSENPEFIQHIADEDIGLMVRGMRESLGVAQITKAENKAKRGGGGGKKSAMKNEMADMMKGLGGLEGLAALKV